MTALPEPIEGELVEPVRTLTVAQPGNALVARPQDGPADMIAVATQLASALKDVVDRQKLFTVINGRKFPEVEAWMTIGRMDNVVAREAERPIRNDDGSYEGFVELVRLSDGMVIGRASALCGTPDDKPWASRAEPARRSMAVTRATSRAFRQQYSWIMALAGYQPTPAEEMPRDEPQEPEKPAAPRPTDPGGLIGVGTTQGTQDFELRQRPEGGYTLPFRVKEGRSSVICIAEGPMAEALHLLKDAVIGKRVTVWGTYKPEKFRKGDHDVNFEVLHVERVKGEDFEIPAPPLGMAQAAVFTPDEEAAIAAAVDAAPTGAVA